MTKQTESDESNKSAVERVRSWYRKNKTTIHAVGAIGTAGVVAVGAVLTTLATLATLAKERSTPEGIESDEREELEELEEKPTRTRCNDGSTSDAGGKQGACSHHGGVAA
ncbi:hypothetical protein [Streptomyces sp. DT203]|uniref:hypothetical protein n=1 Tax=Streptomyces sp. DT203 TaxID=3393424 RepID=UPI003CE94360